MLDFGFIQNSKLLIQNFATCAKSAFPRDHFLPETERSGERLLEAARRVSGSESINKILEIFTELSGLGQEEIQGSGFESGFFRAVVAWINAGVVESAVDPNPVGAVDPSAIF